MIKGDKNWKAILSKRDIFWRLCTHKREPKAPRKNLENHAHDLEPSHEKEETKGSRIKAARRLCKQHSCVPDIADFLVQRFARAKKTQERILKKKGINVNIQY